MIDARDDVTRIKLDNGLTILVLPDKRGEVASVVHWVKVGYFNESDNVTGISHFLEHLFFKGTKTRKMPEISDEIKSLGGYINAGTIYDHTYFYSVLPSQNIGRAMAIIADIIMNPDFPDKEIEMEKSVVIEEIKRKLDSPDQLGFEKLVEMAFDRHRIRRFRMGTEAQIKKITKKDIVDFYSDHYRPNNSIISVVGNFEAVAIVETLQKLYGNWKRGKVPENDSPKEHPQKRPKYRRLAADISQSYIKMGFHSPRVLEDDFYAVNFTAAILGRGRSSRLYKSLKEGLSLVDDIGTSVYADKDLGFFMLEATLKQENFAKTEEHVALEIRKMMDEPPDEEEILKVRNIIETSYFADKEDVLGQSYNLAYFESLGDYKLSSEFLSRSVSVTAKDVLRCTNKYFSLDNLSLLEYVHGKEKRGKSNYRMADTVLKRFDRYLPEKGSVGEVPRKRAFKDFPFKWLFKHEADPAQVKILPGSSTFIFKRNTGIPMTSTALYYPGGRLDENGQNCGITNLVLRASLKGTKNMDAQTIAGRLESLGCSLRIEATADNFGYAFSVLRRNLKDSFSIISDIMMRPSFDLKEIEKEKASMKAAILSRRDDMFRYPIDLCYKALFGIHPYGLPRFGTERSIDSITREDLVSWHENYFHFEKMIACAAGDIGDDMKDALTAPFKEPSVRHLKTAKLLPLVIKRGVKEEADKRQRNQTAFAMGFETHGMSSEDYYPLEVLQSLLSGMGGRLYMEVREKMGLAYVVTGFNISLLRTGVFVIYAATSPKNEQKTKEIILREIENLLRKGITRDELVRAKNYTIGSNSIALQTNLAQAYEYLRYYFVRKNIEDVDRFIERVNAVKEEDIKTVVNKYFKLNNYAVGVVRGV